MRQRAFDLGGLRGDGLVNPRRLMQHRARDSALRFHPHDACERIGGEQSALQLDTECGVDRPEGEGEDSRREHQRHDGEHHRVENKRALAELGAAAAEGHVEAGKDEEPAPPKVVVPKESVPDAHNTAQRAAQLYSCTMWRVVIAQSDALDASRKILREAPVEAHSQTLVT